MVADLSRRNVDGGMGISHSQMPKELRGDIRLAILTYPFEPRKPKTTHSITVESTDKLRDNEQQVFTDLVVK